MVTHTIYMEKIPENIIVREITHAINETKLYKPIMSEADVKDIWNRTDFVKATNRQPIRASCFAITRGKRGQWTNHAKSILGSMTDEWALCGSDDEGDSDSGDRMRRLSQLRISRVVKGSETVLSMTNKKREKIMIGTR